MLTKKVTGWGLQIIYRRTLSNYITLTCSRKKYPKSPTGKDSLNTQKSILCSVFFVGIYQREKSFNCLVHVHPSLYKFSNEVFEQNFDRRKGKHHEV